MWRIGLGLVVGCGGPTADIVCDWQTGGLLPEEGTRRVFTMSCDDYALYGDGLALEEQDFCERELLLQGAESATCTCRAIPSEECAAELGSDD